MLTASISGFGGSYEWGCQRMLQLGLEWLKTHPDFSFESYRQYQNVYGVCSPETQAAKDLDTAMLDDPMLKQFGVTGAMHQAVVDHLAYIHANGHEKWIAELRNHREPNEIFEFTGTEMIPADPALAHLDKPDVIQ